MRRKDREVLDKTEMLDILRESNTLHLAFFAENYPYIVPVSFGFYAENEKTTLYFHCAKEGLKLDLLKKNSHIAFESDIFLGYQKIKGDITTRYKSVIGKGICSILENQEEMIFALKKILEHCNEKDFPVKDCSSLSNLLVCKIEVEEITGKQNLPQ